MNRWEPDPQPHPMPRLLVLLLCIAFITALTAAGLAGEARRCRSLEQQHNPHATTYCQEPR